MYIKRRGKVCFMNTDKRTYKSDCACNRGHVLHHIYDTELDDYGHTHILHYYEIFCDDCVDRYHIETFRVYNDKNWDEYYYLVPNGMSINNRPSIHLPALSFEEHIVADYDKETLQAILQDMIRAKYCTRVVLLESKFIIDGYKKETKHRNLKLIITMLKNVLDKYDTYEWTHSKYERWFTKVKAEHDRIDALNAAAIMQSKRIS